MLTHPLVAPGCWATIRTGLGTLNPANNLNIKTQGDDLDETGQYTRFNLVNGQYRDEVETFIGMPLTPLQYPVFDNFGPDRKVVGLLATNVSARG